MNKIISGTNPIQLIDHCLTELAAVSQGNLLDLKERSYLIVPEAIKADVERRYLTGFQVNGLMLAEVLSFQRFAYRCFSIAGGLAEKTISKLGKTLLLQKILYENPTSFSRFQRFAGKPGYTSELEVVLSDFKKFDVTTDLLEDLVQMAPPSLTRDKMNDLLQLTQFYEAELKKLEVLDADANLNRLANLLQEDSEELAFLKNSRIWITGFADIRSFNRQELRIIELLSGIVKEMTVTVCTDLTENPIIGQELFTPGFLAYQQLLGILSDAKIINLKSKDSQIQKQLQASFLTGNIPHPVADAESSAVEPEITLLLSEEKREELAFVAGEIKRLLIENQFQRREIGIVLADEKEDRNLVKSIFREFGLATFMNERMPLNQTALFRYLQGFLNLTAQTFSLHDLMLFFRTGLAKPSQKEVDVFENICLQYGLHWSYELQKESYYERISDEAQKRFALEFKLNYLDPLEQRGKNLRAKRNGLLKAEYLLTLITDDSFKNRLEEKIARLRKAGEEDIALTLARAFDLILELLEEAIGLFEKTTLSQQAFIEIISNALSGEIPASIPVGLDRIRIGSVREMIYYDCPVLFIVGVSQQSFPPQGGSDAFWQQQEVEWINSKIKRELPYYRKNQLISGQVGSALLFSGKKEKIYLSTSESDNSEWASIFEILHGYLIRTRKTALISDRTEIQDNPVRNIININEVTVGDTLCPDQRWLTIRRSMRYLKANQQYRRMEDISCTKLYANKNVPRDLLLPQVKAFWLDALKQSFIKQKGSDLETESSLLAGIDEPVLLDPLWAVKPTIIINQDISKFWHLKKKYVSASSLERYQSCPYQFLGDNLLALQERPLWDLDQRDRGTLMHKMMEIAISGKAGNWLEEIDDPGFYQLLFDQSVLESRLDSYGEKVHAVRLGSRIQRFVRAALYFNRSLLEGNDFRPRAFEWRFETMLNSSGGELKLHGIIDRIDQNSKHEYRIFDYKTGHKQVDLSRIYHGLDLQLWLYQAAWQQMHPDQTANAVGYLLFANKADQNQKNSLFAQAGTLGERLASQKLYAQAKLDSLEINALGQYAVKKSNQVVSKIDRGIFSPVPMTLDPEKLPCEYCDYKQMCRFDHRLASERMKLLPQPMVKEKKTIEGKDVITYKKGSSSEIVAMIQDELRGNSHDEMDR